MLLRSPSSCRRRRTRANFDQSARECTSSETDWLQFALGGELFRLGLGANSTTILIHNGSRGSRTQVIIPSLLTWVIGTAVLVVLSVVLRYVANEADEVVRSQGRASVAGEPKGAGTFRKAA